MNGDAHEHGTEPYLRSTLTLIVLTLISLAVGLSPAFGAVSRFASSGPTTKPPVAVFGTQTATATGPDERGIYSFGATPGGQLKDHVAVRNYSLQTLTLLIKGTDAINTAGGGFALLPPNEEPKGLGTWIRLPPQQTIVVPPRSVVIMPFEVSVPGNAIPGDHVGGITATLESLITSKSGQRIHLLQSVGSRIFVRVSGPLYPVLKVHDVSVRFSDPISPLATGKARVTYTVSNVGNVALGGRPTVSVSGLFGSKNRASKLPEIQLILPGFSVKETATVSGVYPEFLESAHVSVTRLIVPGSVEPPSGPFGASASFWAIPWVLLAIVVLLIVLAIWLYLRRRRRRFGDATKPVNEQSGGSAEVDDNSAEVHQESAPLPVGEAISSNLMLNSSIGERAPVAAPEDNQGFDRS